MFEQDITLINCVESMNNSSHASLLHCSCLNQKWRKYDRLRLYYASQNEHDHRNYATRYQNQVPREFRLAVECST